jgi:hypothetical protein
LLHLITTIFYFKLLLNGDLSVTKMVVGASVLLVTNLILTALVANGKWKQIPISFISFVIYFLLYLAFLISIGNPNRESDDNPGGGVVLLLFGLPISLLCILAGTIAGIILGIFFRSHITALKERIR